ncbi:MAG: hypothetical protein J6T22_16395 [Bacteroidales bacterium]|nr:hypothetical protein [Bacteroidales bacterium]
MSRIIKTMVVIVLIAMLSDLAMAQTFTYPVKGKQGFSLSEKTRDGLHVSYNLGQFSLSPIHYRGEDMSEINISGLVLPNTEGCPNLPVESRLLAVPQGASARLNVIHVESEIVRNVDIAPALRIQAESEVPEFNYVKDKSVYEKNAFYPEQPFTIDRSSIRGVDVVAVSVSPFQYNPVTKELKVYTNIELSVSYEGGNGHFGDDRLRSPYWDPILASELMNYDQLPVIDYAARMQQWLRDEADGAEYLIITPNNDGWAVYADQLKDYRTRQGILTKVYRLDEMPATTTDEMKEWFHNAYNTWTIPPVAVLLFGDHNSNMAEGIPAEYTYHSSTYGNCITDNFYADPTGDNLPDMVFSRLVAANATEAQMMVSKQIEYEYSNPNMDASTYDHPITALGWQTERWFQICSEVVGGYWRNQGRHPVRINEIYEEPAPADIWSSQSGAAAVVEYFGPNGLGYLPASPAELGGWTGGTGAQVVEAVNSGSMLLQHRDHGYAQGWGEPDFSNNNVAQMNNVGKMTFVNTINCQTGMFDYNYNCLVEAFMRRTYNGQNAGAVGCIGPTQVSYSYVNDVFAWGMYDQFDPDFVPDYGPYASYEGNWQPAFGNVAGKYFLQQCAWVYGYGAKDITYTMFTAHCDAFLRLYTQVPRTMDVAHSSAIVAGSSSISVSAPEGCMISLVKANEDGGWDILAVASATGDMQVMEFEPQVPPTIIHIVVTGQDYLRYEDTIEVVPGEGSFIVVDSYSPHATPVNQQTQLSMTFRNVGLEATAGTTTVLVSSTDDRLTVVDGTGQFGTLGSNQVVTLENEFSFIIAQGVPDNTKFHLNVTMTCGTDTWTGAVTITATQAVLEYVGVSWPEIFYPGETIAVTATFKNTGHYKATNAVAQIASSSQYVSFGSNTYSVGTLETNAQVECTFNIVIASNCPVSEQLPITFTLNADGGLVVEGSEILKNTIITAEANPEEGGTVTGSGSYVPGSTCVVTATAMGEYTFMYWTENGSVVSSDANYSFTVSTDRNLVANFSLPLNITVSANPTEGGTVLGTGAYDYGTTATITATANPGYVFLRWTLNGSVVSGLSTYSFTVTSDVEYVAEFEWVSHGIVIGDASMSNDLLPSYSYWKYTLSQQIYTADEIGMAGEISSIAFFNAGNQETRTYTIYMTHTEKSVFENANDWISVTEADMVFSGRVIMYKNNWTSIILDTPFTYDGTSNLALIVDDNSGSYTSSPHMSCRVFNADGNQAIRIYSDNTNYDPYNPSVYNGTLMSVKNQIILGLPYTITATANPAEYGTVSGAGNYAYGATCSLTAIPNAGYYFVNWTEDGAVVSYDATYSFTVDSERDLVANFVIEGTMCRVYFDLHDSFGDGWNGNYLVVDYGNGNSEQFTIGSGSSASFIRAIETGNNITLTWIAGSWISECSFDIRFENDVQIYHGSGLSASFQYEFILDCEDANVQFNISVVADSEEGGFVAGAGAYDAGTIVNLKATPYVGYRFINWTKDGTAVSYNPQYSFKAIEDAVIVANFSANPQPLQVVAQYYPDANNPNSQYVKVDWGTESDRSTYCIYRANCDGSGMQMIAENIAGNQYIDAEWAELPAGNYAYGVGVVGERGEVSEIHWNNVPVAENYHTIGVSDFVGDITDIDSFGEPSRMNHDNGWLYYDNGSYTTNVGYSSSPIFYWGIMIPSDSLTAYSGYNLKKVALYTTYPGVTTLNVYLGGTVPSGMPVVTQDFNMLGNGTFMEIDLDYLIPIDATQNLWITFYNQGVAYPAVACSNTGDANGRWYSGNGTNWYNLNYTWLIRGYVEEVDTSISWSNRLGKPVYCNAGWNWFSLPVELDPATALQILEETLGDDAEQIKARTGQYAEYDDEEEMWFGNLTGIESENMYMIYVANDCTIALEGLPANPVNHEITINPGWNWIGFPSAMEMNVADVFANFEAEENDELKGRGSYTTFDGEVWFGGLTTLQPGQGYMYYSNSTETKTLVFSINAK